MAGETPRVYEWDRPSGRTRGGGRGSAEVYDWDDPQRRPGSTPANQPDEGEAGWDDSEESSEDEGAYEPQIATQHLIEYLLWSHQRGHMTARQICTVAFWASQAGATGLSVLAVNPRSSGGNYKKRVDSYVAGALGPGAQPDATYVVPVPAQIHSTGSRELFDLHVMPPHEVLATAHDGERASMVKELDKALKDGQLPPCYTNHPVVQKASAGEVVLPLALFLDGVRYGRRGAILGITVQTIFPGSRKYLTVALRKKLACTCGCRKWCTLYPIFKMLHWSLTALSQGVWPESDHLHKLWDPDSPRELWRQRRAGNPLGFKGALVQIRSDWSELTGTLGFPPWSAKSHPCFLCEITKKSMSRIPAAPTMEPFPWRLKGWADYTSACEACELPLADVDDRSWVLLQKLLVSEAKKSGSSGRALLNDIPGMHAVKGDRFEPRFPGAWDWQEIVKEGAERQSLTLWRPSAETMARHRNPLFDPELGTSLWQTVAIDGMHTWCLGIHQQFISAALWAILDHNVFRATATSQDGRNAFNMAELQKDLLRFYSEEEDKNPTGITKVELRMEVLGKRKNNELLCKAAETLGLLRFLRWELPSLKTGAWKTSWLEGATALLHMWELCQSEPMVMSVGSQQDPLNVGELERQQGPCHPPISNLPKRNRGLQIWRGDLKKAAPMPPPNPNKKKGLQINMEGRWGEAPQKNSKDSRAHATTQSPTKQKNLDVEGQWGQGSQGNSKGELERQQGSCKPLNTPNAKQRL